MRHAYCLCFVLLLAFEAMATARELDRDDPRAIARGALEATNADVPRLLRALRWLDEKPSKRNDAAALAVFDALIRHEAKPAAEDLLPWLRRGGIHLNSCAVLVVRSGGVDSLLDLFDRACGQPPDSGTYWIEQPIWLAAGNALARRKAPGFARRLLSRSYLRMTVRVKNTDTPAEESRPGEPRPQTDEVRIPNGFPELPYYTLAVGIERKDLLAPLTPTRTLLGPGKHVLPRPRSVDWQRSRMNWAANLLGDEKPRFSGTIRSNLRWASTEKFVRDAVAARGSVVSGYWGLVRDLFDKGLLTPREVCDLGPTLDFRVIDEREDLHGTLLPDVPPVKLACPFPLGRGRTTGTLPEKVRRALDAPATAIVNRFPIREGREKIVGADWLARFLAVLGPLGPRAFVPAPPQRSGNYSVRLLASDRAPQALPVEVWIDFDKECVRFLVDNEPVPGRWTFRDRRGPMLGLIVELFPPEKSADSKYGVLRDELWAVLLDAKEVMVWCRRADRARTVDAAWAARFVTALGRPGSDRFYGSLPEGLFVGDYEVVFVPQAGRNRGEEVAIRLSIDSGFFSGRRSDMGLMGFWTFKNERAAILKLIKEAFPEDDRLR